MRVVEGYYPNDGESNGKENGNAMATGLSYKLLSTFPT